MLDGNEAQSIDGHPQHMTFSMQGEKYENGSIHTANHQVADRQTKKYIYLFQLHRQYRHYWS